MQFMFFNLILKSWKLFSRFLFLLIVLRVLLFYSNLLDSGIILILSS